MKAFHNKDYSVVKTFKAACECRFFFFIIGRQILGRDHPQGSFFSQ